MLPLTTMNDILNMTLRKLETAGQFHDFHAALAKVLNFLHVLFSDFCATVSCTSIVSSFCDTIFYVVCLCTKKEMFWINARGMVTVVKNAYSCGDSSNMDNPTESVGSHWFSAPPISIAVSTRIFGSCPKPTCSGLFNSGPKPNDKRLIAVGVFHTSFTIPQVSSA